MVVEKTKHEFVDDNPYLVYSGGPDTSVDNAGGGGGGGDVNLFIIEITNSPSALDEYTLVTPLNIITEEWQKQQSIPVIKQSFFYGGSNLILGGWAPSNSAVDAQMVGAFKVKMEITDSKTKVVQENFAIKRDGSVTYTKNYLTE